MSTPNTPQELATIMNDTHCLVLKISASWCGPCKNETFLKAYHDLKDNYSTNSNVRFIEFDVDDDELVINERELYNLNITSVPTIKVFHKEKLLNQYSGAGNLNKVESDIKTILTYL